MLFKTITSVITLAGLVVAAPLSSHPPCATICQDGVNDCGEAWGGCWDICKPEESPTPPPCTSTYTPITPTVTSDPILTLPYFTNGPTTTSDPVVTLPYFTPDPTITLPIITEPGEFTTVIPTPRLVD